MVYAPKLAWKPKWSSTRISLHVNFGEHNPDISAKTPMIINRSPVYFPRIREGIACW